MRGHWQAKSVVVSISSASPCASLAQTLAVAGAMIARSAFFRQLDVFHFKFKIPVKGVRQAFIDGQGLKGKRCDKFHRIFSHNHVYIRGCFFKRLARFAALYAAIPPVTPKIIVFPVNMIYILSVCTLVFWVIF